MPSETTKYVIANDDAPQKLWSGALTPGAPATSFSAEYPDGTELTSLREAKRLADQLAKKLGRSLEVIANFGDENEKRVYIAYVGQQ
jgi:hypothetical protein